MATDRDQMLAQVTPLDRPVQMEFDHSQPIPADRPVQVSTEMGTAPPVRVEFDHSYTAPLAPGAAPPPPENLDRTNTKVGGSGDPGPDPQGVPQPKPQPQTVIASPLDAELPQRVRSGQELEQDAIALARKELDLREKALTGLAVGSADAVSQNEAQARERHNRDMARQEELRRREQQTQKAEEWSKLNHTFATYFDGKARLNAGILAAGLYRAGKPELAAKTISDAMAHEYDGQKLAIQKAEAEGRRAQNSLAQYRTMIQDETAADLAWEIDAHKRVQQKLMAAYQTAKVPAEKAGLEAAIKSQEASIQFANEARAQHLMKSTTDPALIRRSTFDGNLGPPAGSQTNPSPEAPMAAPVGGGPIQVPPLQLKAQQALGAIRQQPPVAMAANRPQIQGTQAAYPNYSPSAQPAVNPQLVQQAQQGMRRSLGNDAKNAAEKRVVYDADGNPMVTGNLQSSEQKLAAEPQGNRVVGVDARNSATDMAVQSMFGKGKESFKEFFEPDGGGWVPKNQTVKRVNGKAYLGPKAEAGKEGISGDMKTFDASAAASAELLKSLEELTKATNEYGLKDRLSREKTDNLRNAYDKVERASSKLASAWWRSDVSPGALQKDERTELKRLTGDLSAWWDIAGMGPQRREVQNLKNFAEELQKSNASRLESSLNANGYMPATVMKVQILGDEVYPNTGRKTGRVRWRDAPEAGAPNTYEIYTQGQGTQGKSPMPGQVKR